MANYITKININKEGEVALRDATALHRDEDDTVTAFFNFVNGFAISGIPITYNAETDTVTFGQEE